MHLELLAATTSTLVLALTLVGGRLLRWLRLCPGVAPSPFESLACGILATYLLGTLGLGLTPVLWGVLLLAAYALARWIRGQAPFDARAYSAGPMILLPLVLAALLVKVLADPTITRDARMIWFFAAKIAYFHGSLYDVRALTDPVFAMQQLDYPKLVSWLGALVARLLGSWNAYVPRLSLLLFAAAIGFGITELTILSRAGKLFLLVALLIRHPTFLVNGYVDLWLAAFGVLAVLYTCQFLACPRPRHLLPAALALAVALNLKNEAEPLVLLIVLVGALLYLALHGRAGAPGGPGPIHWAGAALLVVVPALPWQVAKLIFGIHSEYFARRSLAVLLPLLRADRARLIYAEFWHGQGLDVLLALSLALLVGAALWLRRERPEPHLPARERWRPLALAALPVLVVVPYLLAVSGIYLITPLYLPWHLLHSAHRVAMTPHLLLLVSWLLVAEALLAGPASRHNGSPLPAESTPPP
jgi:hypothetical protein